MTRYRDDTLKQKQTRGPLALLGMTRYNKSKREVRSLCSG
jgi:hypothetical protein